VVPKMAQTVDYGDIERQLDFLQRAECSHDVCRYLADEVRRTRRAAKMSQAKLAERAGIPLRTYKRFEAEGQGSMETLVGALHALERSRYLFMLFPHDAPPRKKLVLPPPRAGLPE